MNFGAHPPATPHPGAASAAWRRRVEEWRVLLAACRHKPGRGRVHRLRVATLRLQAQLEWGLTELSGDSPAAHAVARWKKQALRLRRLLGPVRSADVSLAKLARLREEPTRPVAGRRIEIAAACLRDLAKFETELTRRRKRAAQKLVAALDDRGKRLDRMAQALAAEVAPCIAQAAGVSVQAVVQQIAAAAREFPQLDAGNLHAFRLRLKQANYLADLCAPGDRGAPRLAARLKRMQTAIGEWHDWEVLRRLAARALPEGGSLVPLLQRRAATALRRAVSLCKMSMTGLLGSAAAQEPVCDSAAERKPPVQIVPPERRPEGQVSTLP